MKLTSFWLYGPFLGGEQTRSFSWGWVPTKGTTIPPDLGRLEKPPLIHRTGRQELLAGEDQPGGEGWRCLEMVGDLLHSDLRVIIVFS